MFERTRRDTRRGWGVMVQRLEGRASRAAADFLDGAQDTAISGQLNK